VVLELFRLEGGSLLVDDVFRQIEHISTKSAEELLERMQGRVGLGTSAMSVARNGPTGRSDDVRC
jgi:hypothetical protein